jgi:DNA-nicking Smr family endonuclease
MRRRILNLEERHLWEAVARSAKPITGRKAFAAEIAADPPHAMPKAPPPKARLDLFVLGERARAAAPRHDHPKSVGEALAHQPLAMDAKTHARMTKGKLLPEARLDLHGMTLAEAHSELIHFLLRARAQGLRLVLVITGKGKASHDNGAIPHRIGALRHQLPHWTRLPPLNAIVQQVSEAHLRHGGSGAYYIYLRRK